MDFQNLFQQFDVNVKTYKQILTLKLGSFHHSHADHLEICKCALSWWHTKKKIKITMVILVQQLSGILANQIKTKRIFFIVGIFKAFWRCQIQINNLDKLIFVNKIGLLILMLVTSNLHIWYLYVKLNLTWQRSLMLNLWMKLNVNNF
jgi:hypothetical protein